MRALTGFTVGIIAAAGVWIAITGFRGVAVKETRIAGSLRWEDVWWRAVIVLVAFVVGWVLTGWPAAGGVAAGCATVMPLLSGTRRNRQRIEARSDAVASWAEMLRDTISSHAGLREAIAVTARVAPVPIRAEVQSLAVRAERESLPGALRRFADEVGDPVADLVVASLVIAAERQAQRLAELLSEIAKSAREHAAMRSRVETGRARTYASSRALVAITLGLAVVLMLFSPQFMKPYDTFTGQVVMLGIGALFVGALWSLVQLGRPAAAPRLLAADPGKRQHS